MGSMLLLIKSDNNMKLESSFLHRSNSIQLVMYKQHAFQFEEHLLLFENVLVVESQLLLKIFSRTSKHIAKHTGKIITAVIPRRTGFLSL